MSQLLKFDLTRLLRLLAVLLSLATAGIHFFLGLRGLFLDPIRTSMLTRPLSLSFDSIGVLYLVAALVYARGIRVLYLPAIIYTVIIIGIYFYALVGTIPGFPFTPIRGTGFIPLLNKFIEVLLVAVGGSLLGLTFRKKG